MQTNRGLYIKAYIHTYSNSRFSVIIFLIIVVVGFNFLVVIFALLLHVLILVEVTLCRRLHSPFRLHHHRKQSWSTKSNLIAPNLELLPECIAVVSNGVQICRLSVVRCKQHRCDDTLLNYENGDLCCQNSVCLIHLPHTTHIRMTILHTPFSRCFRGVTSNQW